MSLCQIHAQKYLKDATEGVWRASPRVWRGGFRRYIQRGSRQRAPKAFCSARLLTQHTQWPVDFLAPWLIHPEPHATEGVFRASPSVWRAGYRRYIQRGSRQRASKALCSARLLTQHTQWPVDFWAPLFIHPEPYATEGVLRASPSVWRGEYRRYIQRGSRQRAPKAL